MSELAEKPARRTVSTVLHEIGEGRHANENDPGEEYCKMAAIDACRNVTQLLNPDTGSVVLNPQQERLISRLLDPKRGTKLLEYFVLPESLASAAALINSIRVPAPVQPSTRVGDVGRETRERVWGDKPPAGSR